MHHDLIAGGETGANPGSTGTSAAEFNRLQANI
jgi:hypothetical protein